MSKADAVVAVGRLVAAFRQENVKDDTVEIYVEKLSDIQEALLQATIDRIIETQKFFPAISEIRMTAARIAGLLPATQAEALAIVRRADVSRPVYRRDGSYAYTEREWEWPKMDPLTKDAILDTLSKVGEPVDGEGKAHFGWDTGFQKTYETAADETSRGVLSDLARALLPGTEPPALQSGDR